jgi:threonylcarbamoyladenosine tRNA methylthiotransferase MtaB
MKTVAFYTLGCKLNFSETSSISRTFEEQGFTKIDFEQNAEVFVINTCSVTENADKKCKTLVRNIKKRAPESYVIIIGCYAQLKPQEIAQITGVDAVLGANEKFNLIKTLGSFKKTREPIVISTDIQEVEDYHSSYSINDRTRTFLKVQDGCDYSCTFCTIPLARGSSRSDTIENIVKTAREIAQTNVKEIVLTGVNIGDFGIVKGERKETFLDLCKALDEVEGIDRIRISSIEPNLLKDEIIEFVAQSKRFVPHFHIPLQSGSNEILKAMRRRYKRELYTDRVQKIKQLMPDCCIGVDVIIGFPGESDAHFMETVDFIKGLDVSYLHVFTYSERDNTVAKEMGESVPLHKRNERSKTLRNISHKLRHQFYESQLGTSRKVLFEEADVEGMMEGFTENYVKVSIPFDESLKNSIQEVILEQIDGDFVVPKVCKTEEV